MPRAGERGIILPVNSRGTPLNRMVNEGLLERNAAARRNYFVTENGAAMIMGRRMG